MMLSVFFETIRIQNQSGAWYAEAVDRAVIRKLENIKALQGFKKFSGWRSRRNLPWVTQGMSCNDLSKRICIYISPAGLE